MDSIKVIRAMIEKEVLQDTEEVRDQFLEHFRTESLEFIEQFPAALHEWQRMELLVGSDMGKAHAAVLAYPDSHAGDAHCHAARWDCEALRDFSHGRDPDERPGTRYRQNLDDP